MDNRRTGILVGIGLVSISVFSGLLFVVFVLGQQPTPSEAPPPSAPASKFGGPTSMQTDLDRLTTQPQVPLREAAQELIGDNGVVCGIQPTIDVGTARLALAGDNDRNWLAVAAARGDVLLVSDIPEEGEGTLFVEGFAPRAIRWFDARGGRGGCDPDPVVLSPPEASVIGEVQAFAPHGSNLIVEVCGQPVTLDGDGGFFVAATPEEACVITVKRHYGVWEFRDSLTVTPTKGEEAEVTLEVPAFVAVLPLRVAEGRIVAVWDDGGDEGTTESLMGARIVRVDGEEVPGEAEGFHLATGGETGEEALLELEREGEIVEARLARRALSFDDWLVR
ncbi:MAG: hypothetical protein AAGA48_10945 [Myxococcota bacterium]